MINPNSPDDPVNSRLLIYESCLTTILFLFTCHPPTHGPISSNYIKEEHH